MIAARSVVLLGLALLALARPGAGLRAGDPLFFVDEPTCIGCKRCAEIAPSTFAIEGTHGRARVGKQGADGAGPIREAIRACPVRCIHQVTTGELAILEDWRDANLARLHRAHAKSRLVGGAPPPPWWLPLDESAGAAQAWHPVLRTEEEPKATVDFMGAPATADGLPNVELEDALELKYEVSNAGMQPLRSADDWRAFGARHWKAICTVVAVFSIQGFEILTNDVHM